MQMPGKGTSSAGRLLLAGKDRRSPRIALDHESRTRRGAQLHCAGVTRHGGMERHRFPVAAGKRQALAKSPDPGNPCGSQRLPRTGLRPKEVIDYKDDSRMWPI